MASKGEKDIQHSQNLRKEILAHVHALHFREVDDYQAWCLAHGFSPSLKKTSSERTVELRAYRNIVIKQRLRAHNRERNLRRQLRDFIATKANKAVLGNDLLHEIQYRLQWSRNRKLLGDTFTYLEAKSDLLAHVDYVRGIDRLVARRKKWIRPVTAWVPKTHNAHRQFASLARHLLAHYSVPSFMDSVWLSENDRHQDWFVHIGQGGNIRTAAGLPLEMTKKMAHCFVQAPAHCTVEGALRWGQVIALGGRPRLAQAVIETVLGRRFKDNAFWESVLQFFIRNPMLDVTQVNPIVDYIWNQKYDTHLEHLEGGGVRRVGPAQPNFAMRGRSAASLLRQVEQWHRRLGREASAGDVRWPRAPVDEFTFVEGSSMSNRKVWTIRELLSSSELVSEGRQLRHCVASYARSCFKRTTSIWTLDLAEQGRITKRVTIELGLPSKTIHQVRGRTNRMADAKERDVIRRWMQQEGLKGADFL